MKAIEILKRFRIKYQGCQTNLERELTEAIEELEAMQVKYRELDEYYWFARNHLKSYRCKCGSLGRVGYLCSNKKCNEF